MDDPWSWWREAVEGRVGPIHSDPVCGYFKVRDRRGLNKDLAPIKRPWVAAAIWMEGDEFKAEMAGSEVSVDNLWPYVAKNPIPFDEYAHWHEHGCWPERKVA